MSEYLHLLQLYLYAPSLTSETSLFTLNSSIIEFLTLESRGIIGHLMIIYWVFLKSYQREGHDDGNNYDHSRSEQTSL